MRVATAMRVAGTMRSGYTVPSVGDEVIYDSGAWTRWTGYVDGDPVSTRLRSRAQYWGRVVSVDGVNIVVDVYNKVTRVDLDGHAIYCSRGVTDGRLYSGLSSDYDEYNEAIADGRNASEFRIGCPTCGEPIYDSELVVELCECEAI